MRTSINLSRFLVLGLLVAAAAATRALPLLVPHIWNFTAVGALAIFAGAQFRHKVFSFLIPVAAMALSDIFIGNGFNAVVYGAFLVMVLFGYLIRNIVSVQNVAFASLAGALAFYLITNFAYFYPVSLYPHSLEGVIQSYIMGLPFLKNMLIGDLVYGVILFYGFHLLEKRNPALVRIK